MLKNKLLLKSFLILILGGLVVLLPQISMAVLWVDVDGTSGTCIRQATEPSQLATCSSLAQAASSSTSGETIYCGNGVAAGFAEAVTLNLAGNSNTTWTNWPGQLATNNVSGLTHCFQIVGPTVGAVTIENFRCLNGDYGVHAINSGDNTIQDNIFNGQVQAGVLVQASTTPNASNHTIQRNQISEITNYGIRILGSDVGRTAPGVDNTSIFNNIIFDVNEGINLETNISSVNIINNTISAENTGLYMHGTFSNTFVEEVYITDNIFDVTFNSSAIGINAAAWVNNWYSDYNDIWISSSTSGCLNGTCYPSLAAWQGSPTSPDANSLDIDPLFVGGDDYHIQEASPVNSAGIDASVYGVSDDIDGDPRPNSQGEWSMGADQRDDPPIEIPEFTILTLILALISGAGIIFLIGRIKKQPYGFN